MHHFGPSSAIVIDEMARRIRGGFGTDDRRKTKVVKLRRSRGCTGGGGDGLSDAVRLRADESRPGGLDPRRGWKCGRMRGSTGKAIEDTVPRVDAVLDTVGGETQHRSFRVLKPGGILVSVISPPEQPAGFRSAFFIAEVTTTRLSTLISLLDSRKLSMEVGTVLPLDDARRAHEMLADAPHKRGKLVLTMRSL